MPISLQEFRRGLLITISGAKLDGLIRACDNALRLFEQFVDCGRLFREYGLDVVQSRDQFAFVGIILAFGDGEIRNGGVICHYLISTVSHRLKIAVGTRKLDKRGIITGNEL